MGLMRTEFGILQSLIRSETLAKGVDGQGLLWIDLLGAIWEKFVFSEEKFVKGSFEEKGVAWEFGDFSEIKVKREYEYKR